MSYWNVDKIKYVGTGEKKSGLGFQYYNPDEVVGGKKMRDWLRFAVAYGTHLTNG